MSVPMSPENTTLQSPEWSIPKHPHSPTFNKYPWKSHTNFVTSFLSAVHTEDNNLLLLACAAEACKTDYQVSALLLNLGLDCQKTNLPWKAEKMFSLLLKIPTQIDKGEKNTHTKNTIKVVKTSFTSEDMSDIRECSCKSHLQTCLCVKDFRLCL